jgi:hypothetical protein
MKLIKIVPILVILLIGVVYSCDSDMEFMDEANSINNIDQKGVRTKIPSGDGNGGGGINLNLVDLGSAESFAILSKTGITNVTTSSIIGNVGASPITGTALILDCAEVQGTIYTVNGAGQQCGSRVTDGPLLTEAVVDMEAAYVEAAGRPNPIKVNLGGGSIGGNTLTAGVYKWTTNLEITTDITLSGSSNDVWIFQVSGKINMAAAMTINLAGGAKAENIFWQSAGDVTLGTSSNFEGTILGMKSISLLTGASLNGRAFAQTAVVLQQCSITKP